MNKPRPPAMQSAQHNITLSRHKDEEKEDIKPNGDDEENNYFLLNNEDEDTKEKSGQEKRDNEEESDCALLTGAEEAPGNEMVKAMYHVLEKPGTMTMTTQIQTMGICSRDLSRKRTEMQQNMKFHV